MRKLQWSKEQVRGPWQECMDWASSLEEDGHTDWRLPMIDELYAAFDRETGKSKIEDMQSDYYWSATTSAPNTAGAWGVVFSNGYVYNDYKTGSDYARCVREME